MVHFTPLENTMATSEEIICDMKARTRRAKDILRLNKRALVRQDAVQYLPIKTRSISPRIKKKIINGTEMDVTELEMVAVLTQVVFQKKIGTKIPKESTYDDLQRLNATLENLLGDIAELRVYQSQTLSQIRILITKQ